MSKGKGRGVRSLLPYFHTAEEGVLPKGDPFLANHR